MKKKIHFNFLYFYKKKILKNVVLEIQVFIIKTTFLLCTFVRYLYYRYNKYFIILRLKYFNKLFNY